MSEGLEVSVTRHVASGQSAQAVKFRMPTGRWGVLTALAALWLISTALTSAIYWGGYVRSTYWQGNAPVSAHLTGIALIALLTMLLVRLARNELINAVWLYENRLQFKGWFGAGSFNYDEVKIIRIISVHNDALPRLRLILQFTRGRARKLWLPSKDAKECFNALRNLCDHAIAFGLGDQMFLPVNPEFTATGLLQFASDRLRKTLFKFGGGVVLCAIYPWWLTIPARTPFHYRFMAVFVPFIVVVLLLWAGKDLQQYTRLRAAARRAQSAHTTM